MNDLKGSIDEIDVQLPAAYELVYFDQLDSLRTKAIQLANQGAEEGTLIWANNQTAAKGRLDKQWICNSGDLHCALIIRPDFETQTYYQMLLVAAVSLGNSIASYVSPMTALGYQWPNDICIANHKTASIWLDQGACSNSSWLVISVSCNIVNAPNEENILAMSINQAQDTDDISNQQLLESFSREFVKQINNWSQRGYGYIFDQWRMRLENIGQPLDIVLSEKTYQGVFESIDDNGNLSLLANGNTRQQIRIDEYMGLR